MNEDAKIKLLEKLDYNTITGKDDKKYVSYADIKAFYSEFNPRPISSFIFNYQKQYNVKLEKMGTQRNMYMEKSDAMQLTKYILSIDRKKYVKEPKEPRVKPIAKPMCENSQNNNINSYMIEIASLSPEAKLFLSIASRKNKQTGATIIKNIFNEYVIKKIESLVEESL